MSRNVPSASSGTAVVVVTADPLARVKRAATAKRRAEQEYGASLQAARDAAVPVPAIARAAGISRQAVYKLTRPS